MGEGMAECVGTVRRFNRFYTNILGLLDRYILNSTFSFSEIRILYEIGQSVQCTAKYLVETVRIDPGYLSRIISKFEERGYICRERSSQDGRYYKLFLSDKGKEILADMSRQSDRQIAELLHDTSETEQKQLVKSMASIEAILTRDKSPESAVTIRAGLRPGDAGEILALHGKIYSGDLGYNHEFEGYVCHTLSAFFKRYDPEKDGFWFAQDGDKIVGCIAIVAHSKTIAQLRWFLLEPDYRGRGLGKLLLDRALEFSRANGFSSVYLETTADQKTALVMYQKSGFVKTEERPEHQWGKDLVNLLYELKL